MYLIPIESTQAVEWLERLINNTLDDPNANALKVAYANITAWKQAIDSKMDAADILALPEVHALIEAEVEKHKAKIITRAKPTTKKTTRRKSKTKPVDEDPYKCKDHPTYGVKQMPRNDCDKCWDLYKQFHPLDYKTKRAAFERKLRQANK